MTQIVIGLYDEMSASSAHSPHRLHESGDQWLDPATVAEHAGRIGSYALQAISRAA